MSLLFSMFFNVFHTLMMITLIISNLPCSSMIPNKNKKKHPAFVSASVCAATFSFRRVGGRSENKQAAKINLWEYQGRNSFYGIPVPKLMALPIFTYLRFSLVFPMPSCLLPYAQASEIPGICAGVFLKTTLESQRKRCLSFEPKWMQPLRQKPPGLSDYPSLCCEGSRFILHNGSLKMRKKNANFRRETSAKHHLIQKNCAHTLPETNSKSP